VSLDPNPAARQVVSSEPTVRVVEATPAPAQVVVEPAQPVIVQQPLRPVRTRRVWTSSGLFQAWDSIVVGIIGTALLLIGLVALVRAGTDGPWDKPVVEVLGFTHTAILGLVEIGFGICLLLSAVTLSRAGATFFGALLGIGAFVGAVQTESFRRTLALESSFAWLLVVAAVVIIVVSALVPRLFVSRTTTYVERY
jgi:hypothetical protein